MFNSRENVITKEDIDSGFGIGIPPRFLFVTVPHYLKDIVKVSGIKMKDNSLITLYQSWDEAYDSFSSNIESKYIHIVDTEKMYLDGYKFYPINNLWYVNFIEYKYLIN